MEPTTKLFDLNRLIRDNVKRLKPYSSARDEFKDPNGEMIFLDANENPFENGVNRYPDPQQRDVKAMLAALKNVAVEQILLGNGSDEVLDLIFRAFCEPGRDNIITLPPTYGMYKVLAETNNIEAREVLLLENFQPDLNGILNAIDEHSKLIFICSPNNPTGNIISTSIIKTLLQDFNGLVVIDEAYIDFSESESWLSLLDTYKNLVVVQTLSKAYGLAGIRLGIGYASKEIIAVLNKIKPPYNVNELTQKRAAERLEDQDRVTVEIQNILTERQILVEALNEITFVTEVFPSEANFILARVDNAEERYSDLLKKGIVVRNRSTQPLCQNTLRFTVGTKKENEMLIKGLKELNKI